jgi:very-short-patch-repair endonuclease
MRKVDGTEALARVRELRRTATPAEEKLWAEVRDRRLGGFKFRFQTWVGPFIADFLCKQARLIVEVDGSQHADQVAEDAARSAWLDRNGYRVLRVWNNEVLQDIEPVLAAIRAGALRPVPSPSQPSAGPLPLPSGEG